MAPVSKTSFGKSRESFLIGLIIALGTAKLRAMLFGIATNLAGESISLSGPTWRSSDVQRWVPS
ncbi:hypothetical protein T484DRAFT_1958382 [Baffinella frigidus]|nr:hypothetical protein T484DRAFT_1958382 [Cryptophyta sp. CCMP2293]